MISIFGFIKEGKLHITNRKRFAFDVSKMKDCNVEIIIRKKNTRTSQQNRYLFGVVYKEIQIQMNNLGNDFTVEDVHDFCKDNFNKIDVIGQGGEIIGKIGVSTANMNKDEFSIYLDKIIFFAADTLGIEIPLPNTELKLIF